MMTSAVKGHEVRAWFIQKEKELEALKNDPASILNLYPELRAIAELAVSTAQARARADAAMLEAEQAKAAAAVANANAARALETQLFFTVAEYITFNQLQHQIPTTSHKPCSDYLRAYCLDNGIPFRKIPVGGKPWDAEYGFHVSVWTDVFPKWLQRRFAQGTLHAIHTE